LEPVSQNSDVDLNAARLRRPSQIALALDRESQVLFVNRDLAGTGFSHIQDDSRGTLHELLHPDCDGQCRFNTLLKKAWKSLEGERASVEWEIEDPVWEGCLRLNLFRPLTSSEVSVDRRRRFALMTVTDITDIRREFQSVLSTNEALQQRVNELEKALGVTSPDAANEPVADYDVASQTIAIGAQIIAAQERERRRIASDLHDGVAQSLGVLKFGIESRLEELRRLCPDVDVSGFEPLVDQLREALTELRKVTKDLSPALVSEFGICTAIDMLCKEFNDQISQIDVECLACVQETYLPEIVHVAIYRVVQEALNNACKHAGAARVGVRLASRDGMVTLDITDDGEGFDPDLESQKVAIGKGLGLDSMRERVEVTGGRFELRSQPGQGTTISASWPESTLKLL
jgi:signal transduction histidine kinase